MFLISAQLVMQFGQFLNGKNIIYLQFPESELKVEVDFTIRRTGKLFENKPLFSLRTKMIAYLGFLYIILSSIYSFSYAKQVWEENKLASWVQSFWSLYRWE